MMGTEQIPGIPKPPGTRRIKLTSNQVAWVCQVGPWPFTCEQNVVSWPNYTDEQAIAYIEKYGGSSVNRGLIVRKLMGEIE